MRKYFYGIFVLLAIGLFVISGCQKEAVGRPIPQVTYTLTANPVSGEAPLEVTFELVGDYPVGSDFTWYMGNGIAQGSTLPITTMDYIYTSGGSYQAFVEVRVNGQLVGTSNNVLITVSGGTNPVTYQGVLEMLNNCEVIYQVSQQGGVNCNTACQMEDKTCIFWFPSGEPEIQECGIAAINIDQASCMCCSPIA